MNAYFPGAGVELSHLLVVSDLANAPQRSDSTSSSRVGEIASSVERSQYPYTVSICACQSHLTPVSPDSSRRFARDPMSRHLVNRDPGTALAATH